MTKIPLLFLAFVFITLKEPWAVEPPLLSVRPHMIYIYAGKGASEVALKQAVYTLKNLVSPQYEIEHIHTTDVIKGDWIHKAALFVMPGGADIPYAASLKGRGNHQIKTFVEQGGAYLGFCAGAYYGSKQVKFSMGTPLEVVGERELAFFPGIAEGPTLKPYDYKTNSGAAAALLKWTGSQQPVITYFNGGCHFVDAHTYPGVTVLANYATHPPLAAIVEIAVGRGRVILSGAHCEFAPELLDTTDKYLVPIHEELFAKDSGRLALMTYILNRLGIKTKERSLSLNEKQ